MSIYSTCISFSAIEPHLPCISQFYWPLADGLALICTPGIYMYMYDCVNAANINDRSMLGERDSEMAIRFEDKEMVCGL